MEDRIRQLIRENRKLASSEHYWHRAVIAMRRRLEEEHDERFRARLESQLRYCERRESTAVDNHITVVRELETLDPEGSARRLRNSIDSNISHVTSSIQDMASRTDPLSCQRLDRLKIRLSKLEARKCALPSTANTPDRATGDDQEVGKGSATV